MKEQIRGAEDAINDLRVDLTAKQAVLENTRGEKAKVENKLCVAHRKNDELRHLLKYHKDTEEKMSTEATTLLDTANDTVSIIEQLHGRLERKQ